MSTEESFVSDFITLKKLAHPLITRKGKTTSQICKEFSEFFSTYSGQNEKEEKRLWDLLACITSNKLEVKSRFDSLAQQNPDLIKPIAFLNWLEQEYTLSNNIPTDNQNIPFYYIRTGQLDKYIEFLQKQKTEQKIAFIAGALSQKDFKVWRKASLRVSPDSRILPEDKAIFNILAGDRTTLEQHCVTYFDNLWAEITIMLTKAFAGDPFNVAETISSFPPPTTAYESSVVELFRNGGRGIANNDIFTLRFRVHCSAIFGEANEDIITQYIAPLIENRYIGLVLFYCSLLSEEECCTLVGNVLAGLPQPEKEALRITNHFSLPSNRIIESVIDRIISSNEDDFDVQITEEELIDRKIAALGWLEFAQIENLAESKVRKLLGKFAVDREFRACEKLLSLRGSSLKNEREHDSWNAFIIAELYPTEEHLLNVLNFKGGWFQDTETDEAVLQSIVPLVVFQLFDLYMKEGRYQDALMVFGRTGYPPKNLAKHFTKDIARQFLLKGKQAVIAQYAENEKELTGKTV